MRDSLEELNNRSKLAEESLNRVKEIKQFEEQREKDKMKRLTEMWDTKKYTNIQGIGSTRRGGGE